MNNNRQLLLQLHRLYQIVIHLFEIITKIYVIIPQHPIPYHLQHRQPIERNVRYLMNTISHLRIQ